MALISIVTPCYNEEENVDELCRRISAVMAKFADVYDYEHILIDNASTDGTVARLREISARDKRVKIIVNTRNFGHIRSPFHAMLQGKGDAVIGLCSDLQDPPEMIESFLKKWEEGYKIVFGVKNKSEEASLMFTIRRLYYSLASSLSEVELIKNATGFGLYDRAVIEHFRAMEAPYPYVRGLVSELGYEIARVEYTQPRRERGITKNNFFTLYDYAMLGITTHSKLPLRLAAMMGFVMSGLSMFVAIGYLLAKLIFWESFTIGIAPVLIGIFFFASVQLFFIGVVGEYVGSIHMHVVKRPLVVEKERINFD